MTKSELAGSAEHVKAELDSLVLAAIGGLAATVNTGGGQRALELATWSHLVAIGRTLLAYAFALRCLRSTLEDVERRGLRAEDYIFRSDAAYHATLTTTLGEVGFPMCSYRDSRGPLAVTRTPARDDFLPSYRRCRSSELCLEWETRLGAALPFRRAQAGLRYFTHDAVRLEDTTVARHMVTIGAAITKQWLYRPPDAIAAILQEKATRDLETSRPIVYASSDALALRRYVDDTWAADWKMANGIRLWCIDRSSGATIHLGGEYTFGDCNVVEAAFLRLIKEGYLPRDGHYSGVHAHIVIITDGMPWIEERIVSQFTDAVAILDCYHALQHIAAYASVRHKKGTKAAKHLYNTAASALLGGVRPEVQRRPPGRRKGHKKPPRTPIQPKFQAAYVPLDADRTPPAAALLKVIVDSKPKRKRAVEARDTLVTYITGNADRLDYPWFRSVGYQIGSGAMESLHRNAAQLRLKLPGARWLAETAEAIFSLRMLALVEREDEFWSQPGLTAWIHAAFAASAKSRSPDEQVAA